MKDLWQRLLIDGRGLDVIFLGGCVVLACLLASCAEAGANPGAGASPGAGAGGTTTAPLPAVEKGVPQALVEVPGSSGGLRWSVGDSGANSGANSGGGGRVYPTPQSIKLTGEMFSLENMTIIVPAGMTEQERYPAELFQRWVADEYLVNLPIASAAPPGRGAILLGTLQTLQKMLPPSDLLPTAPDHAEGYDLSIAPGRILAVGRDYRGTLYAVATMMQLLERSQGKLGIAAGTVRDWPYMARRYVHLYSPGPDGLAFFKRYVRDVLLRYKYNGIVLEVGGGVRLDSHPEIAAGWKRTAAELYAYGEQMYKVGESAPLGPKNRFQDTTHRGVGAGGYIGKDDLRDIAAFARACGQDIVPEIQSLTHVYYLAGAHREIAEVPEANFPDAYCPSNPKSYELLFDVMDEYIDVLKPAFVHIGHDEWRAGGLCPLCSKVSTADLYAQDVIKIYQHLKAKGVGTWMWADHFVSGHNEAAKNRGTEVWFNTPSTVGAWKKVAEACPDLVAISWSWGLNRRTPDVYDQELRDRGFHFLYGNFDARSFQDWEGRSKKYEVLGGEVSSWCAMDEFELGKMHIPNALYSIEPLWSGHNRPKPEAARIVMALMPETARRLKGISPPDIRKTPDRQHVFDLSSLYNSPLKDDPRDLTGLKQGGFTAGGLAMRLGPGVIAVRREQQTEKPLPLAVTIPVHAQYATLVFLQSSVGKARGSIHAGDDTFFPQESSELIGLYEIVFEDGLILTADIRANQNVAAWDAGISGLLYHARCIEAGTLADGSPLVIWGREWTNPRPDQPIKAMIFRGAGGATPGVNPGATAGAGPAASGGGGDLVKQVGKASDAAPLLLGITGVEKVKFSDYR